MNQLSAKSIIWSAGSYIADRFPMQSIGASILFAYSCAYLLFSYASNSLTINIVTLFGALSFLLMFFQLRLIDDLDDLRYENMPVKEKKLKRKFLIFSIIGVSIALVLLNWNLVNVYFVMAIIIVMLVVPFVIRPLLQKSKNDRPIEGEIVDEVLTTGSLPRDIVSAFFYEGQLVIVMVYVYLIWRQASVGSISEYIAVAIIVLLWGLYEIWKYTRYLVKPNWNPYNLSWSAMRRCLFILLFISAIAQLTIGISLAFSIWHNLLVVVTTVYVLLVVYSQEPKNEEQQTLYAKHLGLSYVLLVCTIHIVSLITSSVNLN